ncbi:MAG: hypothetical protein LBM63_05880 [Rikenellaceae bacterium]|jgi:hypothetical protein|nr:hypothetical protein [Rikenellaceae bacterium]
MKLQKGFNRPADEDVLRKPAKLAPAHKSGKERHSMFGFDDDVDEADEDFGYQKRESILDYFDDDEDD